MRSIQTKINERIRAAAKRRLAGRTPQPLNRGVAIARLARATRARRKEEQNAWN